MTHAAGVLAIQKNITHDRSLLKKVGEDLKAKKTKLLGENRVAAPTTERLAWLLWNSPSHRSLLLHKNASVIGIHESIAQGERFAVIAVGSAQTVTTAKSQNP